MNAGSSRKRLFPVACAAVTAGALLLSAAMVPARSSTSPRPSMSLSAAIATSPPGKMVVVSSNLLAGLGDQPPMRPRMALYVSRLLDQTPYYPDVLLLQEVKRKSADRVAYLLSKETGDRYVVAVRPPWIPWHQNLRTRWERDSGIVINATTTKKLDRGGYISLTYKRSDAADPTDRVEINQHARLSVAERVGNLKLGVASVHFQYKRLKNHALWRFYQKKWEKKVNAKLASKYPGTKRTVGGDFNRTRCINPGSPLTCKRNPFWRRFVNRSNYRDSIYKVWRDGKKHLGLGGVDFIFTKGDPTNARDDRSYDPQSPSEFYSDHRFLWAVISAR
jgi:endonuclease/exonuclease/phosphatase family metal-dependent hydrolase